MRVFRACGVGSGYKAIHYNLVVATNEVVVRLWKKSVIKIIDGLPSVFYNPTQSFVDANRMYKMLKSLLAVLKYRRDNTNIIT